MAKRKIVMFLGAGASKAFDYPLTKEIFKLIIEEINNKRLYNDINIGKDTAALYRQLVTELLIGVSPGLRTIFEKGSKIDENTLPLITDLLSQAEHLLNHQHSLLDFNFEVKNPLLGNLESLNERWELKDVITLIDWAIIHVINKYGKNSGTKLNKFIDWVCQTNVADNTFISIVTTNYDFAIEWNLLEDGEAHEAHELIDYGFNWRDTEDGEVYLRPRKPKFSIFKLHGSADWLKCDRCGYVYINPAENIYELAFSNEKINANKCHCLYWPLRPVLVTPSFSRTTNDTNLSQIWRNTLELLRTADEWIISGYSLPPEDLDIKSLFIRALKGRSKPPKIQVIQQSENSKIKFDYFFGSNKYEFISGGFENFDFSKIKV